MSSRSVQRWPSCCSSGAGGGRAARASRIALSLHLSRAAASLDAGRGDVHRARRRAARAAHEPLVARAATRSTTSRRTSTTSRRSAPTAASCRVDAARSVRVDGRRRTAARVTVRYKVFGDRARRHLPRRSTRRTRTSTCRRRSCGRAGSTIGRRRSTFEPPAGAARGRSRRSCIPGSTPFEFTAPNLQYLMDSPVEFGPVVDPRSSRSTAARSASRCITPAPTRELDAFVARRREDRPRAGRDLRRVPGVRAGPLHVSRRLPAVRQRRRHGASQQHGDHLAGSLADATGAGCSTRVAHEFFHGWNVERIRPRSLEPFDFERANMSGELWLAEGLHAVLRPAHAEPRRAG